MKVVMDNSSRKASWFQKILYCLAFGFLILLTYLAYNWHLVAQPSGGKFHIDSTGKMVIDTTYEIHETRQ